MQRENRRLAAIVAADIAGYSRLIGQDEEGTLRALRAHRKELIDGLIDQHGGRIANTAGDSLLLEFPSVVDAARCVLDMQSGMADRNHTVPAERRIAFRVGLNLGDVIAEGTDLLGDGVNVAARVQELADPGGIMLAGAAHDQVRDRLDISFEDIGEVEVKNIARPVRVFRVLPKGAVAIAPRQPVRTKRWLAAAVVVVPLIAAAGGGVWWWWQQPNIAPVEPAKMAYALPDKPYIAVLPFANLSGEPAQESFADGISEDLTTQLSKISGLFVISRTTAFQYKGRTVDIRQIARELGVRYVVEGSVRRGGDQIRINAQLIDAVTGGHLWADTFDGAADAVFALQDRINGNIVAALKVELTPEEEARVSYRGTENVAAYDAFLRGERIRRYVKVAARQEAIREYERAIELDPNFGAAHAALGDVLWNWAMFDGGGSALRDNLARAHMLVEKAIALGEDPLAHTVLAKILLKQKVDHDRAEQEARKAIALDPNNSESLVMLAEVQLFAGEVQAAIALLKKAMRLNPVFPDRYRLLMAQALFDQRRYRDALDQFTTFCEDVATLAYKLYCLLYTSSANGYLGEAAKGQAMINYWFVAGGQSKSIDTLESMVVLRLPFKNKADHEHLMAGIRKSWPTD